MKKEPAVSYEEAIGRLSEIVTMLDKGDTSLEDSIKLFEEGTKLAGFAQKLLAKADQKVVKLTQAGEKPEEEEFDIEGT